jgi:hypothetical protein
VIGLFKLVGLSNFLVTMSIDSLQVLELVYGYVHAF